MKITAQQIPNISDLISPHIFFKNSDEDVLTALIEHYFNNIDQTIQLRKGSILLFDTVELHQINTHEDYAFPIYAATSSSTRLFFETQIKNLNLVKNAQDLSKFSQKKLNPNSVMPFNPFSNLLNCEKNLHCLIGYWVLTLYSIYKSYNKQSKADPSKVLNSITTKILDPDSILYFSEDAWLSYFKKLRNSMFSLLEYNANEMNTFTDPDFGFKKSEFSTFLFNQKHPNILMDFFKDNSRQINWFHRTLEAHKKNNLHYFYASIVNNSYWESSFCLIWHNIHYSYTSEYCGLIKLFLGLPDPYYSLINNNDLKTPETLKLPVLLYTQVRDEKIQSLDENLYLAIRHAIYIADHCQTLFLNHNPAVAQNIVNYIKYLLKYHGKSVNFKKTTAELYKHITMLVSPIPSIIANRFDFFDKTQTYQYFNLLEHKNLNYTIAVYNSEPESLAKAERIKQQQQRKRKELAINRAFRNKLNNDADFRNEYYNAYEDDRRKNTGSRSSNERSMWLQQSFKSKVL